MSHERHVSAWRQEQMRELLGAHGWRVVSDVDQLTFARGLAFAALGLSIAHGLTLALGLAFAGFALGPYPGREQTRRNRAKRSP